MRAYLILLRLPYQWQLGPLFAWGFLLGGGDWSSPAGTLWFWWVFFALHIGCFGGLTALNSYYDRDGGPIGGVWQPPPPPRFLMAFAGSVQALGLLAILAFDRTLAALYSIILLLALGYSHPHTRWKGRPWLSWAVVAVGQGALTFWAGAQTAGDVDHNAALWSGGLGATLTVMGFYPLTQLFQNQDDMRRGDFTTAVTLQKYFGRNGVFRCARALFAAGILANSFAAWSKAPYDVLLIAGGGAIWLGLLGRWSRQGRGDIRYDWEQCHRLLRVASASFGLYVLGRLWFGGYQ